MAYKGRWFVRLREFVCGDHIEADIYPVFQQPGRRREKCRESTETRKKLNHRDRVRRLVRILRLNFSQRDIVLHLTYRDLPADLEEAKRLLKNYLDRLRRIYRKAGVEFKWLYTTEYGRKSGRVHHHLVLSGGVDREVLEKAWGLGYANADRLQMDDGLERLAAYLCKGAATYRCWSGSRNLIMPEPAVKDGAVTMEEMGRILDAVDEKNARQLFEARYPGYDCLDAGYEKNEVNGGVYIRVAMRRKPEQKKKAPVRKGAGAVSSFLSGKGDGA